MKNCVSLSNSQKRELDILIEQYNFGIRSSFPHIARLEKEKIRDNLNQNLDSVKGIISREKLRGCYKIQKLAWDTEFFGFPCASVPFIFSSESNFKSNEENYYLLVKSLVQWCEKNSIKFISIKCDSRDIALISVLAQTRCNYLETTVNLVNSLGNIPLDGINKKIKIRPAIDTDLPDLGDISASSKWDRFHVDHRFSRTIVDKYRRTWITNLFNQQKGIVLVAEVGLKIVGFLTCELEKEGYFGMIKLVAVAPEYRQQQVGSTLTINALKWFKERTDFAFVSTQASNFASIKMYTKYGFKWAPSSVTFHKWWLE